VQPTPAPTSTLAWLHPNAGYVSSRSAPPRPATPRQELRDPPGTKNSAAAADVVSLPDAWLAPAIAAGLLQPVPNAENSRRGTVSCGARGVGRGAAVNAALEGLANVLFCRLFLCAGE
jgi:hypothetical protein